MHPSDSDLPPLVFPGAFHPVHEGHLEMARVAERMEGRPLTFELSIANVDKPPLDYMEIEQRASQFTEHNLALTDAATFVEKGRLFPGCTFVVGADTIVRIGQTRYYNDDPEHRDAALAELAELGCRFLVFGRQHEGRFEVLSRLELPMQLKKRCKEVPESEFRRDLSSTELRSQANS